LHIYAIDMARPKNIQPSKKITITATPKLKSYLEDLVQVEGYGASRGEVARNLAWRMIEYLISKGIIEQRRAQPEKERTDKKRNGRSIRR
jgi:hypothetical protein